MSTIPDTVSVSVGFLNSPELAPLSGFLDGGIRITVSGTPLTKYTGRSGDCARYDVDGNPLSDPDVYVGEEVTTDLTRLRAAAVTFRTEEYERFQSIPSVIWGEPGIGVVTLSFCDGEHARIAFEPRSAEYSDYFPTAVTVGYAVDPIELCQELIACFEDCVTFAERAYGMHVENDEAMKCVIGPTIILRHSRRRLIQTNTILPPRRFVGQL